MDFVKKIYEELKTDVLPLSLINSSLDNKSDNAKKSFLKRACQKGDLIRVRKGLYLVGEGKRRSHYNSFVIANYMVEPSYVSLESALSFYGLIPEAVYTTTSVTTKVGSEVKTPVGQYSFSYLKTDYFNFGFYQIKDGDHKYLIATPLKALMDYIVLKKKEYKSAEELEEDLRFDFDEFLTYKKFVSKDKINEIITERLNEYNVQTAEEELNAIKEITQEIILYALSKNSFFSHAHFCGGTALRIIHGLNRFSEDLNFTTNVVKTDFQFNDYMDEVLLTLKQYGLDMKVKKVKKAKDDNFVKARELKEDSAKWMLSFPSHKQLKKVLIKLEIDTNPPVGAVEVKANLDFPLLHQVKIGSMETFFSGKLHALLCRSFLKGRDWYDLLWYIKKRSDINYELLKSALFQMGPYQGQDIGEVNRDFVVRELSSKIKALDWKEVRRDVERFLKPEELDTLKLWDEDLFLERVQKII